MAVIKEPDQSFGASFSIVLLAMVLSTVMMGASPIFVRIVDVGPFTSAFWRVAAALPVLALWVYIIGQISSFELRKGALQVLALSGLFFAGDLAFWHLSIMQTSVTNATLLSALAPVWVILGARFFFGETLPRFIWPALGLCLVGAALIMGYSSIQHVWGDIFGLITSLFFAAYFFAIQRARNFYTPSQTAFGSTFVTALILLPICLVMEDVFLPQSFSGLMGLLALAWISQVGGQGLLGYALGHLPTAFSALLIFLEVLAAAFLAWIFLGEAIMMYQVLGGGLIVVGILLAKR